jgi:hypothetical protein
MEENIHEKISDCLTNILFNNNFYIHEEKLTREFVITVKINIHKYLEKELLGSIEYVYTKYDKSLLINHVNRYSKVPIDIRVNEKLIISITELFIYKLIIDNFHLNYIYLYAVPESVSAGKEFCLMCYYEKLGFTHYDIDEYKKTVKYCKKQLMENYKKLEKKDKEELEIDLKSGRNMCLLCKCQKAKIDLSMFDFGVLSVEMKYVIGNIDKILNETYKKLC